MVQIIGFSSRSRRSVVSADGMVDVYCCRCHNKIGRFAHRPGITRITCIDCAEGKTPIDRLPQAEEEMLSLYSKEELAEVAAEEKAGFIRTMFRALGFGRPPAPPDLPSKGLAKSKKRRPLFSSGPDKDPIKEAEEE